MGPVDAARRMQKPAGDGQQREGGADRRGPQQSDTLLGSLLWVFTRQFVQLIESTVYAQYRGHADNREDDDDQKSAPPRSRVGRLDGVVMVGSEVLGVHLKPQCSFVKRTETSGVSSVESALHDNH